MSAYATILTGIPSEFVKISSLGKERKQVALCVHTHTSTFRLFHFCIFPLSLKFLIMYAY